MQYLKKKKLYKWAELLFSCYDFVFPKLKDCSYRSGFGQENLSFCIYEPVHDECYLVHVGCLPSNRWFHLSVRNEIGNLVFDSVKTVLNYDIDNPVIDYSSDVNYSGLYDLCMD